MSRSIKVMVMALFVVFGLAGVAAAEDIPGPPGSGVSVRVPTGWKASAAGKGSEGFLVSISPDEEASVMYAVAEAENLQKAVKALDGFLAKFVTGGKLAKVKKGDLNGMKALMAKGSGKVQGRGVAIAVVIAETPTGKVLFIIGIVNAAKKDAYKKTLEEVLAGVLPAR